MNENINISPENPEESGVDKPGFIDESGLDQSPVFRIGTP